MNQITRKKSLFKFIEENRDVKYQHVEELAESVAKYGVLRPIIVDTNFNILDGQHLFLALDLLKYPFEYLQVDVTTKEEIIDLMAKLNNTSKSWSLEDFINMWATVKPDYRKILEKMNKFSINANTFLILYVNDSGIARRQVKEGRFKGADFDSMDIHVQNVLELKKFSCVPKVASTVRVLKALVMSKGYDHIKMFNRLKTRKVINFPDASFDSMYTVLKQIHDA